MNELKHQARNNIMHAVYHLEQNKIHIPGRTGWYCGNKQQFIERHVAAIEYFKGQLNGKFTPASKIQIRDIATGDQ
jgi:hypothetical protein